MRKGKLLGMLGLAAMLESSMMDIDMPEANRPKLRNGGSKSPLTPKQQKQKAKNRAKRKAGKKSRR